jgi:hypothetical protein
MRADEFVRSAVGKPGVGEMSGLTAHFFFGAKSVWFSGQFGHGVPGVPGEFWVVKG